MNSQTLYDNLIDLCKPEDAPFYYVDHALDGVQYRIFTYRLGQYTDFIKPHGRECRGHMFEVDAEGKMKRLAALPMPKFFNLNENPITMDLDLSVGADTILDKEDGSLISSFVHLHGIRVKSKASLSSDQANAAWKYLQNNAALYNFVEVLTVNNYTVNMEFTSPEYRIVVPHQDEKLTVLNVRKMDTGVNMAHSALQTLMDHYNVGQHCVKSYNVPDLKVFLDSVPLMNTGIEGYVVTLKGGETFKVKTNAYVSLHRMKDSIGSAKRLFEVVVNEAHDDAKAAFANDPFVINAIVEMEKKVAEIYTSLKVHPIAFHNANRALDRKSYAIKGQAELDRIYFGLAMSLYLGKEPDYKEWMLKHYKELGIKDDPAPVDNEG